MTHSYLLTCKSLTCRSIYTTSMGFSTYSTQNCQFKIPPTAFLGKPSNIMFTNNSPYMALHIATYWGSAIIYAIDSTVASTNHCKHFYWSTVINANHISWMANLTLQESVRHLFYIIVFCMTWTHSIHNGTLQHNTQLIYVAS